VTDTPASAIRDRADRELIGARVIATWINEHDGYLFVELEHRGCDDEACILAVDPAAIEFRYPEAVPRD
jgi:hypothetical protein